MVLPVREIQQALQKDGIDGWLLYDFHGSNPIAARITGLDGSGKMATRRWYYLIPASGVPRGLVHAIERHNLEALPGETRAYAGREQLSAGLARAARRASNGSRWSIRPVTRSLMFPGWTRERSRPFATSASRSSRRAIWCSGSKRCGRAEALATHRAASERLYRIKDRAFDLVRKRVAAGGALDEIRSAAGDGRVVCRRRPDHRRSPVRSRTGERRQSALSAHRHRAPLHRHRRSGAAGSLGQAADARRGLC